MLAGSGCYRRYIAANTGSEPLDAEVKALVKSAFEKRKHEFLDNRSVLYVRTGSGREVVVLLEAAKDLSETDQALVEIWLLGAYRCVG